MQTHFNITEAKANLSKIIAHIEAGGDPITLTRAGKPVAEVNTLPNTPKRPAKRPLGWGTPIDLPDDWDEWPEAEAKALGIIDDPTGEYYDDLSS